MSPKSGFILEAVVPQLEEASSREEAEQKKGSMCISIVKSKNNYITDDENDSSNATMASFVYIRDEAYAWLPARVISLDRTTQKAKVHILKPANWTSTTVSSSSPVTNIKPRASTGVTAGGSIAGNSQIRRGGGGKCSLEPKLVFSSQSSSSYSDGDGHIREVNLKDYRNTELPLQNLSLNHALLLTTDGHHNTTSTSDEDDGDPEEEPSSVNVKHHNKPIASSIIVKANMADLPFLHEASVLYNVKDLYCRPTNKSLAPHEQCVPYTRVGDIVIALNPFTWMDHLYSEKMQMSYADRLVWSQSSSSSSSNSSNATIENSLPPSASSFLKAGYQPHVYETSSLAYRALLLNKNEGQHQNQTILVSGESGAGKTETVKIVMNHLAKVQSMKQQDNDDTASTGNTRTVVERVLESNPLFEAFGNAKTTRNDNSSRFGKFTSLIFQLSPASSVQSEGNNSSSAILVGSTTETYMLEKSRVVAHGAKERTYHIFYQLLAASDELKAEIWPEGLVNTTFESFAYVGHADTHSTDDCHRADREAFEHTLKVLKLFDIVDERLTELFRALCIVMQLGNLTFGPPDEHDHDSSIVTPREELDKLSHLMDVPSKIIEAALTTRAMQARGESFAVSLTPVTAKEGCDALARELYARLFDYLVTAINKATRVGSHEGSDDNGTSSLTKSPSSTATEPSNLATISILDLFGFECFDVNRFEQLCINYANEKLQQKYVLDNFQLVKDEYISEGIDLFDLSKVDNSGVLNLLEGRREGIITALNDECLRSNGSASSLVYKIKTMYKDNTLVVSEKLHRAEEFGIQHFVGCITYDATNFVERNIDVIPQDLVQCAIQCTNSIVSQLFTELQQQRDESSSAISPKKSSVATGKRNTSASKTVAGKFRLQLNTLVAKISESRTRYIRCIRPNKDMVPGKLDHNSTIRQLSSAGLVTAITISRETYPDRLEYDTILERFNVIAPHSSSSKSTVAAAAASDPKQRTEEVLALLLKGFGRNAMGRQDKAYALGKTRVYFRTGALEFIESKREQYYATPAIVLQAFVRCKNTRFKYLVSREKCILLQPLFRARYAQQRYRAGKWSIFRLQALHRRNVEMTKFYHMRRHYNAIRIQARYRGYAQRVRHTNLHEQATNIQRLYLIYVIRKYASIILQTRWRCHQQQTRFWTCLRSVIAMQRLARWNSERKRASTLIQVEYRGHRQRWSVCVWNMAASRLQRWYIRTQNKNTFSYDLKKCKASLEALHLQSDISCVQHGDLAARYFSRRSHNIFAVVPSISGPEEKKSKKSKFSKHLKNKLGFKNKNGGLVDKHAYLKESGLSFEGTRTGTMLEFKKQIASRSLTCTVPNSP
jgi:myosin heavy subunit